MYLYFESLGPDLGAWKTHGRRRRPEGFGGWNFNVYFILCLFSLGLGGTFWGGLPEQPPYWGWYHGESKAWC